QFNVFAAVTGFWLTVQGQERLAMCRRMDARCQTRQVRNGRSNDVSRTFNQLCRSRFRNWRDISRCELARATCLLTWERCDVLSCDNVRSVLGRGGGGGEPRTTTRRGPTPRTTTRRGPTPRTTTRRTPRTTSRRTPNPRTTTRRTPTPRTTTRRTPTPR
ncbi:hypothetical protein KR018_009119, partial [Drosophila ironensis]